MDVVLIFRTAYYDESQHTANGDAVLVTSGWLIAQHYVNPWELNRYLYLTLNPKPLGS